ncbi:hypothetical protein AVEN_201791-1 [Araneus ventricosus]|uniref:Uncharacterized protein n=1 Tax=Araneus ventricosus TaxID=182803 RepID=A0A4Y2K8G3_ARAVE|nr:hypothetical protein AVEN_201791-1 [Araneus ventricosus]
MTPLLQASAPHQRKDNLSRRIWLAPDRLHNNYAMEIGFELEPSGPQATGARVHHECRPQFALFPIVGAGRSDVVRELVSALAVSRIMAVNSSHVKGRGMARWRQCSHLLERCRDICQSRRRRNYTDHSPQVRTSSDSMFTKPYQGFIINR